MEDLDYNLVPHEKYYTVLLYINLGHIDKQRMFCIAFCWGARLEPVDPNITSTGHVRDWIGKPP